MLSKETIRIKTKFIKIYQISTSADIMYNANIMYTPKPPSFTILKWGWEGSKLNRLVNVMIMFMSRKLTLNASNLKTTSFQQQQKMQMTIECVMFVAQYDSPISCDFHMLQINIIIPTTDLLK